MCALSKKSGCPVRVKLMRQWDEGTTRIFDSAGQAQ